MDVNELPRGRPAFLFHAGFRIYSFRTLIVATIACIPAILSLDTGVFGISMSSFYIGMLVHHILSVIRFRFYYEVVDVVLISLEIAVWFYLGCYTTITWINRWAPTAILAFTGALWLQIVALTFMWVFRVASIIHARGKILFRPHDLLSGCGSSIHFHSRRSILFGRALWQSPSRGEAPFIKLLRALLALAIICGLFVFGLNAIIAAPLRETTFIPSKTFRATMLSYDDMSPPVWGVIVAAENASPAARDIDRFKNSVTVTPQWDGSGVLRTLPQPPCITQPGSEFLYGSSWDVNSERRLQGIQFYCPDRLEYDSAMKQNDMVESASHASAALNTPDLLVVVNFTALGMVPTTLVDARMFAISVIVSMTRSTEDVVKNTEPIPLHPGSHILVSARRELRQQFSNLALSALGLFGSPRTFWVTKVTSILPDFSPLIPRDNNTATLRIYLQNDMRDWVVVEDYREKAIWDGFASVGGFWTFFDGLFAIVFGSGLMLVVFGAKPIGFFGIVHQFQKKRLRHAWNVDFPKIKTEGGTPGTEEAGLVAFLRERLIDIDLLEEKVDDDVNLTDMPQLGPGGKPEFESTSPLLKQTP
ncbi:hypothetical protein BD779DRAFT_1498193 [Infundibulicybe gibba]|nr:hypothetical protein BD779DRAFT_1498193 [Infundibulicybe gibba]